MAATTHQTEPAAVITQVIDHINAHDAAGLGGYYADELSEDWPIIGHLDGKQAAIDYWTALFAALPNLKVSVERMVTEGDAVFVHWLMTGTFSGSPISGILATGRAIELRGTDYFTVHDGTITAAFVAYDGMSFAAQAGILPQHGSIADRAMIASANVWTWMRSRRRRPSSQAR